MNEVLVTGAAGFLGRQVVRALVARGIEVRAMVRPSKQSPPEFAGMGVRSVRADLRMRELGECINGVRAVIHLAACVVGDEDTQFLNTGVGTENLLASMRHYGVRRLVHCSSMSVYDWRLSRRLLDESSPVESGLYDRDGYAIAKVWQERLVRRFADQGHGDVTIVRPGFIWGKGNELPAGIGHSFGSLHVVIAGARSLPLTYVENCAQLIEAAVSDDASIGQTVNVVDDDLPSAWSYAGAYLRRNRVSGVRVYVPYWFGMALAYFATAVSRGIYREKGKLPGLLVPCRFRARFRPLRFTNLKAKRLMSWTPSMSFQEACDRISEGQCPALDVLGSQNVHLSGSAAESRQVLQPCSQSCT